MGKDEKPAPPRTSGAVRRNWWPGWIWAIPIAALIVIGWLGVRALTSTGEDITITFGDVHGLSEQGGKISYRGLNVGRITKVALADDDSTVDVSVTIEQSATHLVRSGTRFWLRNAHPSLSDLSSLGAVLSGPSIVMEPGPGDKATHFTGLAHEPIAPAVNSEPQHYNVSFEGPIGDLSVGDAVKLRGFTVGEVKRIGFAFDEGSGHVSSPVALDLYPSLFHIQGATTPDSPAALHALLDKLIQQGLRARLERDPPLIGGYRVTLDMEPGAPAPASTTGAQPQIPAASGGGGLSTVVDRLKDVPVGQIAQNVLDLTRHADELVSSPDLKNAVVQLDAAIKQVHAAASQVNETASSAGPKITKLVESLRRTADQLDRAATSASRVAGGTATQYGLEGATEAVTEAARSVRALASYLDRHPEALIQGRSGGP